MVRGVPSFLCYTKDYDNDYPYIPKHSYSGSDQKLDYFSLRVKTECKNAS